MPPIVLLALLCTYHPHHHPHYHHHHHHHTTTTTTASIVSKQFEVACSRRSTWNPIDGSFVGNQLENLDESSLPPDLVNTRVYYAKHIDPYVSCPLGQENKKLYTIPGDPPVDVTPALLDAIASGCGNYLIGFTSLINYLTSAAVGECDVLCIPVSHAYLDDNDKSTNMTATSCSFYIYTYIHIYIYSTFIIYLI